MKRLFHVPSEKKLRKMLRNEKPVLERTRSLPSISVRQESLVSEWPPALTADRVKFLLDRLEELQGLETHGVFRVSGVSTKINEIVYAMASGDESLVPSEPDAIHDVACSLKQYLNMQDEPLCTFAEYDNFIKASYEDVDTANEASLNLIKEALARIPPLHRLVMHMLARFLAIVCSPANKVKTCMNCCNCGIVFGPVFFRPKDFTAEYVFNVGKQCNLVEIMITHTDALFGPAPVRPGAGSPAPAATAAEEAPPKAAAEAAAVAAAEAAAEAEAAAAAPQLTSGSGSSAKLKLATAKAKAAKAKAAAAAAAAAAALAEAEAAAAAAEAAEAEEEESGAEERATAAASEEEEEEEDGEKRVLGMSKADETAVQDMEKDLDQDMGVLLSTPVPASERKHKHKYKKTSFSLFAPVGCRKCGKLIWGLRPRGYVCQLCDFPFHKQCTKRMEKEGELCPGQLNTPTTKAVEVGDKCPNIVLTDHNDAEFNLHKILAEGYNVCLFFYPKSFTPGCVVENKLFRDYFRVFFYANFKVVGISSDSGSCHNRFAEKYNLPFQLLSDRSQTVRKSFGVPSQFNGMAPGRVTYIISNTGKVKFIHNSQLNPEEHIIYSLKA
eukprot:CAMPEP_0114618764 /NCGR_PEP_ID=MMETSP0168-20121206/7865_1 /TAXON_ID=95228 ORGANISM="Vannella sp., Strain DIVA3 517/6/12" /NCGR_SAMPLE_ID=MMETSP0168 /ASSEMBLY_ACC=CAM_ASM_000044 /LENGTH=610 /DNA_ID=CAMNT_0001829909 /DNA_START=9 /DNA_END=1837 /DNA_ORIENTATION=+